MTFRVAIDWDGTVRQGFTLRPWINHLHLVGIIGSPFIEDINILFEAYENGTITHDSLAESSAELYAQSLRGSAYNDITAQAEQYSKLDSLNIIVIVKRLIEYLGRKGADIAIISGAPIEVITQYRRPLGIPNIFGLRSNIYRGRYLGTVLENPGISRTKEEVLKRHFMDFPIDLAIGNSLSDIPLFKHARKSIVIDNPEMLPELSAFHLDSDNEDNWVGLIEYVEVR